MVAPHILKVRAEAAARRQDRLGIILSLAASDFEFSEIARRLGIHPNTLILFCRRMGIASERCVHCGKKAHEAPHLGGKPEETHRFVPRILTKKRTHSTRSRKRRR